MKDRILSIAVAFLLGSFWSSAVYSLPEGFVDQGVARLRGATGFCFAPLLTNNNKTMLLVTDRKGLLWVFADYERNPQNKTLALDLSDDMCYNGERGLSTVQIHPNFTENRFVYVFYTAPKYGNCGEDLETGPVNRVARYQMKPHNLQLDPSTATVLLETSPLKSFYHNGGDMVFGDDDCLYVTIGE